MSNKRWTRAFIAFMASGFLMVSLNPSVMGEERDYDSEIAALEDRAAQIAAENSARQSKIERLRDDASQYDAYIDEVNTQIEQIQVQVNAYSELVNAKEDAISEKRLQIEDKERDIQTAELLISAKEVKIEQLNAQNAENLEKFGQIIKQMFMNSESDTISLLMGAQDFYDLLVRTEMIKNVSDKNVEFMESLLESIKQQEDAISELEDQKNRLEYDKDELEGQKLVYEQELKELEADLAVKTSEVNRQNSELNRLQDEQAAINGNITSIKQLISATNAEVEAINAEVSALIVQKQQEANRVDYSSDGFIWPLNSNFKMVTCAFTSYDPWRGGPHYGVDIGNAGIGGASIYAMQSGTVIKAFNNGGYNGGYGNYVVIDHGGGVATLYAHASSTTVVEGQEVSQGQVIGYVGRTGWATGNHLHFEVRINGSAVNPMNYF